MSSVSKLKFKKQEAPVLLCLDLGTGKGALRPEGFVGVDIAAAPGVDIVADLRKTWPWKNDSVDEASAHNILHLLTAAERLHFVNELCRVLKQGAKAAIVVPHWAASRAYADPAIQWPPVTEAWFMHLNKGFRDSQNQIDASGFTCDFDFTLGYGLHPALLSRNQEYQQHAVAFWKEAAQDMIVSLIKK